MIRKKGPKKKDIPKKIKSIEPGEWSFKRKYLEIIGASVLISGLILVYAIDTQFKLISPNSEQGNGPSHAVMMVWPIILIAIIELFAVDAVTRAYVEQYNSKQDQNDVVQSRHLTPYTSLYGGVVLGAVSICWGLIAASGGLLVGGLVGAIWCVVLSYCVPRESESYKQSQVYDEFSPKDDDDLKEDEELREASSKKFEK